MHLSLHRLAPGSFPWLLLQHARIGWRSVASTRRALLFWGIGVVFFHLYAFSLVMLIPSLGSGDLPVRLIGGTAVVVSLLMLSTGLLRTVAMVAKPGHIDLFLSAPIPHSVLLLLKGSGVALIVFLSAAAWILPFANVFGVLHAPALFALYPGLAAMALIATATAFIVAFGLIRAVGAKWASRICRGLGMAIACAPFAFILLQGSGSLARAVSSVVLGEAPGSGRLAELPAPVALSVTALGRALTGEILPLALLVAGALLVFTLVGRVMAPVFLAAVASARLEVQAGPRGTQQAPRAMRTESLRWLLVRKEWRQLWRNKELLAGLSPGLTMAVVIAVSQFRIDVSELVRPGFLFTSIPLAACLWGNSIAWLIVRGEEAPDLLASAPRPAGWERRTKCEIAVLFGCLIPLSLLLPLAVMAPVQAAKVALCTVGAALSSSLPPIWHGQPVSRRDAIRRSLTDPLSIMGLTLLGIGWMGTAVAGLFVGWWIMPFLAAALFGFVFLFR